MLTNHRAVEAAVGAGLLGLVQQAHARARARLSVIAGSPSGALQDGRQAAAQFQLRRRRLQEGVER